MAKPQLKSISSSVSSTREEESCGNCACFLLREAGTGKGRCRLDPPARVPDHEATKEDSDGKRWPIVFESEWCKKWEEKE